MRNCNNAGRESASFKSPNQMGRFIKQISAIRKGPPFQAAPSNYAIFAYFASRMMLKGVSVALRSELNPPSVTTSRNRTSPACAPKAMPTSCASDAGVQIIFDAE